METSKVSKFLFLPSTCSYPTYEEWKLVDPDALAKVLSSYPTYEEWKLLHQQVHLHRILLVLILPMRNGNSVSSAYSNTEVYSSYPTYEEWKLLFNMYMPNITHCSYPTYEEWKPPCLLNILYLFPVLILPMRNGNLHQCG